MTASVSRRAILRYGWAAAGVALPAFAQAVVHCGWRIASCWCGPARQLLNATNLQALYGRLSMN